jgi:hypothetical protein
MSPLAEIAHDSATEQALQIAEGTGWMLPGSQDPANDGV